MNTQDMRKMLESMKGSYQANQEAFEECMTQLAQIYFFRYRALVDAGFSEQQAFEIIRTRGLE